MITMTYNDMTDEDKEAYTEHLKVKNLILCSYSRLESFLEAQPEINAAANYTIKADSHVLHNTVYIFDEEGFMRTYILDYKSELN